MLRGTIKNIKQILFGMTWNERLESLMKQGLNRSTVKLAFELHNEKVPELFPKKETKTFCGGCTQRVWRRLNDYYNAR